MLNFLYLYPGGGGGLVAVISDSCDPMDYNLPGSSVHGILQARILVWVAISFSISLSYLGPYYLYFDGDNSVLISPSKFSLVSYQFTLQGTTRVN